MSDSPATNTRTKETLLERLANHNQQHLIAFWDELSTEEQERLARQIEAIDFEQLTDLYRGKVNQPDWAELSRKAEPPPAVRLSDRVLSDGGVSGIRPDAASQEGIGALRAGKVGVIITAGGQGSRLGFELPKAVYPIGPVSEASLLQIHLEKVLATSRRHEVDVPVYIMTSPATHDQTVRFLAEHDNFGLAGDNLVVFCQGTMPAVDQATGKLLLADKGNLFLSPDGHGGTVAALEKSGALEQMQTRGIEQLFYLQVDNPLIPICDPQLIGYHLLAKSELTSIAVAKTFPQEKVGNFAMIDGRMYVIEYSDLPDEVAQQRDENGELKLWAGSIAVHVFERSLFDQALSSKEGLPFHVAHKKVPFIDESGAKHSPEEPNALKFEKFIFDLLPMAENPLVVEYAEGDCFAPLKNAPGAPKDTPEYVQKMLLAQHRSWLEAAGAKVAEGVQVEISPLYAQNAEEVAERIQPGQEFNESQYLR